MKSKYYQNYHKHTSLSNVYISDSPLVPKDYFEYYKSLNCPQIYSTLEHGFQGNYFKIYDDLEKFNKKNNTSIKFVFGVEAYWVKDRFEKDNSNCHICLLAINDKGRKAINKAISEANKTGYYYRPRLDTDLILSLPKDDVFVTSACIAFWNKYDDIDNFVLKLNKHFSNFYLEVQAHNTQAQKELNQHILELSNEYNIPIIFGTDSHVIKESQMKDRDDLLKSKKTFYEDEVGWYVDCPTYDDVVKRFQEQGILNNQQIETALQNTNVILDFEDIILDRSLKVPVVKKYQNLTQDERNEIFVNILRAEWKKQIDDINKDKWDEYIAEIKQDIEEIEACGMADYFILSYEVMKLGQEKYGGVLTPSGRGSAVSMYINKLLRLTKVDRINSPVLMYPERFLTKERVLESHTPPDVDNNVSEREPFIEAQRELIGENGTYDLIAFGTLHYKSAFKMYARAYNLDPQVANDVTKQIDKYELALKHAEDDEKDLVNIFDYVERDKYENLILGCQDYMGIIDNRKGHPCFTEDALVMTSKGYKNINNINIGDLVLSHDNQYHIVTNTMNTIGKNNVYDLKLFGSPSIKVTENHPFFVAQRIDHQHNLSNYTWKSVSNLDKKDLIAVPVNIKSEIPSLSFVDSGNYDFWWVIGRYLGDGWRSHTIRKTGEKTGQKIKDVIICCNKNNNETQDIVDKIKSWSDYRISENNTTNKIYIKSNGLYEWLEQFGDYAYNKHLTDIILNLPEKYLHCFLDGYLSADGHFDKKQNTYNFTTVSKELALGIVACINKVYKMPCSLIQSRPNRTETIQGRLVHCKAQYKGQFHISPRLQDSAFYKDGYIWCPFRKKTSLQEVYDVYNLEVKDSHSYTVNNYAVHNCATICFDGDVEEDIGIILCKSETTGKEVLTALIESGTIDAFGYLKQDYLVVDSVGLMYKIYEEIGIEPLTVNELLREINNNQKVWDIYKNGYAICVNQCEQPKSTQKVMKYKPKNISELTQFIAGIRPSFQSMYKTFEAREHFEYGIKTFDQLLQDEYCDSSFILYQETLMKVLGFAGFPMSETYTIIKAISKKKDYIIKEAKPKFIKNFAQAIIDTGDAKNFNSANELAEKVWKIVEDSSSYGFNCVSGDTKMCRPSTNGKYNPTIEEMYLIKNDREYAKRTNHLNLHDKYNRYGYGCGLSMDEDGIIKKNKIIDIYQQPKAMTYTIITSSGKQIQCTENHKFPTKNGIKLVKDLNIGESLYCVGKYQHQYFDSSLTNGDFIPNTPIKGEQGFQTNENGASVVYDNFRKHYSENSCVCEMCGEKYSIGKRFEVHHKDLDRKHNSNDNFQWLCASCHKKVHYQNGRTKQYDNGLPTYFEEIVSIISNKEEIVYDVSMSEEVAHNFALDNGIVTCNCSHAFCMAIDSVTLAYLKAYYPLEFYKVTLQRFTDKGEKDKVSLLKKEMLERGYNLKPLKFGDDNRKFLIDKYNNCITQTMTSIKNMPKSTAQILYKIRNKQFTGRFELYDCLLNQCEITNKAIDILLRLDYFNDYVEINQGIFEIELFRKFSQSKVLSKDNLSEIEYSSALEVCNKETEKQFRDFEPIQFIKSILSHSPIPPTTTLDKIHYEITLLGYTTLTDEDVDVDDFAVINIEINQWGTPWATLYNIYYGNTNTYKTDKQWYKSNPIQKGDIIKCGFKEKDKRKKIVNEDGSEDWIATGESETVLKVYSLQKEYDDEN